MLYFPILSFCSYTEIMPLTLSLHDSGKLPLDYLVTNLIYCIQQWRCPKVVVFSVNIPKYSEAYMLAALHPRIIHISYMCNIALTRENSSHKTIPMLNNKHDKICIKTYYPYLQHGKAAVAGVAVEQLKHQLPPYYCLQLPQKTHQLAAIPGHPLSAQTDQPSEFAGPAVVEPEPAVAKSTA